MLKEDVLKAVEENPSGVIITPLKKIYYNDIDMPHFGESGLSDWRGVVSYGDVVYVGTVTEPTAGNITLGSDPEFFFVKKGKVVPSKFVVTAGSKKVTCDGFQGELNPSAHTCREISGSFISDALKEAGSMARNAGARIALRVGVDIDSKTFNSIPKEERRFGCSPTDNPHENIAKPLGERVKFRSGAGHIHLGGATIKGKVEKDKVQLIKLLDIVCGNTCVLVDRDKNNATRRKYYGRAGEHRVKPYGLEYRVPSNFWLRHYMLWSMVTALARNAVALFETKVGKEILETIDIDNVREAINTNNKALALKIFNQYTDILKKHGVVFYGGIDIANIDLFKKWVSVPNPISLLGVGTAQKSLEVWRNKRYGFVPGFERGLVDVVKKC